jgi:hypothetical protein
MTNQQKILNGEQTKLVVELTQDYGIKPEDIIFFSDNADPFFSYEANCYLLNQLTDVVGIELEPVASIAGDSISTRCELTFPGGKTRSGIGVANLAETLDGEKMSEEQTRWLSESRAIRTAVRTAGIDFRETSPRSQVRRETTSTAHVKSNRAALLGQAHAARAAIWVLFGTTTGRPNKGVCETADLQSLFGRELRGSQRRIPRRSLLHFLNTIRPVRKAAA